MILIASKALTQYRKKITNIEMRGTIILLALFLPLGIQAPFIDDNLEYLYPIYKLIEDTIKSDQTLIFKINQAFSPAVNLRYWQVDGAEVVPIEVCLILHEQPNVLMLCNIIGVRHSHKVKRNCTACWNLRWTNSLLLNLIPGDILLAMEPVITAFLYSDIVHSSHHRRLHLDLHLNDSILPQQKYSMDDYEQAFALFITQVSKLNNHYYMCMYVSSTHARISQVCRHEPWNSGSQYPHLHLLMISCLQNDKTEPPLPL